MFPARWIKKHTSNPLVNLPADAYGISSQGCQTSVHPNEPLDTLICLRLSRFRPRTESYSSKSIIDILPITQIDIKDSGRFTQKKSTLLPWDDGGRWKLWCLTRYRKDALCNTPSRYEFSEEVPLSCCFCYFTFTLVFNRSGKVIRWLVSHSRIHQPFSEA